MTASTADLMTPHEALALLVQNLHPVETESLDWSEAAGRVLAQVLTADRASPAIDVSAMDGYAVRLSDLRLGTIPVAGEVAPGQPPSPLPPGHAMRIFTGAGMPAGAEAVVRREDCEELAHVIIVQVNAGAIKPGQHIRFQGENLHAGEPVVHAGCLVHEPLSAALASFGTVQPTVYRRVRLSVLVTGDELLAPEASPRPWQLRDSNGPALRGMFASRPWIDWRGLGRIPDAPEAFKTALERQLAVSDAVLLTGGVSMGDHDYVPDAVRAVGGHILFHKLAIRPGKPLLGAVGPQGQAILGLPGNPVSVMTTARTFAAAALRRRAGFAQPHPPAPLVRLQQANHERLKLWSYRPVRLIEDGLAELVRGKGSGDVVAAARSDGMVRIPPHETGQGPWPYFPWTMT